MVKLVSLVKGKGRYKNIIEALTLIKKDLNVLKKKKKILIKPNVTALDNKYANTDKEAIKAVIDFLQKNFPGKDITIADGCGSAFYAHCNTKKVFKNFGYYELEKKYKNVKVKSLDDYDSFFEIPIKTVIGKTNIRISKEVNEYDFIISLAIPKTHNYGIATFGIKNMMGFVKKEDRILMHGLRSDIESNVRTLFDYIPPSWLSKARRNLPNKLINFFFSSYPKFRKSVKVIHSNLAFFAKHAYPDLVVLDGYYGMEGDGPIDGTPIKMDISIASTDALKADSMGARCMGFNPDDIGYIHYLSKDNVGDISLKGLVGENPSDCSFKFKRHGTYPLQKEWK